MPLHGFGLLVALGFYLGSRISMNRARRIGLDPEHINRLVQARVGQGSSAPMVIESLDFAQLSRLSTDAEWASAAKVLAASAKRLEKAGATAILIGANAMHKVYDQVAGAVSVPVLQVHGVQDGAIVLHAVDGSEDFAGAGYTRIDQLAGRSPESLLAEIKARDERDSKRATSPLVAANDAVVLDTSEMDIATAAAAAIAAVTPAGPAPQTMTSAQSSTGNSRAASVTVLGSEAAETLVSTPRAPRPRREAERKRRREECCTMRLY